MFSSLRFFARVARRQPTFGARENQGLARFVRGGAVVDGSPSQLGVINREESAGGVNAGSRG